MLNHKISVALLLVTTLLTGGCASTLRLFNDNEPIRENPGKRTLGSWVSDEVIETKVLVNIRNFSPSYDGANIGVTSFNGVVLLTGQVASNELREQAAQVAGKVRDVRRVHNELQIAGVTSGLARSNDLWLTSKVKTLMYTNRDIDASRIKVVTENGIVYLLGLVTRDQADKAVNLVRQVGGVVKIVKVFEYIG